MIKQFTKYEFDQHIINASKEGRIDLEFLQELCFDVRLTDSQHELVLNLIKEGVQVMEAIAKLPADEVHRVNDWTYKREVF